MKPWFENPAKDLVVFLTIVSKPGSQQTSLISNIFLQMLCQRLTTSPSAISSPSPKSESAVDSDIVSSPSCGAKRCAEVK